jgi:hypothetical protein
MLLAADWPGIHLVGDSNADGFVTAGDALSIANYLNGDRLYDVTSALVMARMVRMDATRNSIVNADDFYAILHRLSADGESDVGLELFNSGVPAEGEEELPLVSLQGVIPFLGQDLREWKVNPASNESLARFRVERSGGLTTEPLTVKYQIASPTAPGVATPGIDYEALTGTIVIPAGEMYADIFINVTNDAKVEGQEIVSLALMDDAAYTINYAIASDHLYITDNDYWNWDTSRDPGEDWPIEDQRARGQIAGYSTGELVVYGWSTPDFNGGEVKVNVAAQADFTYEGYFPFFEYHREVSDGGLVSYTFDEHGKIHRSTNSFAGSAQRDGELSLAVSYTADIQDTSDTERWVKITPHAAWVIDGQITFKAQSPPIQGFRLEWGTTGNGGYGSATSGTSPFTFYLIVYETSDPPQ